MLIYNNKTNFSNNILNVELVKEVVNSSCKRFSKHII